MRRVTAIGLAALAGISAAPAAARVEQASERGFVIGLTAQVAAAPEQAWAVLVKPGDWWNPEHSYSGNSANLSLDPRAGGCFCETLPAGVAGSPARGGVEHARVVYAERPRTLRMVGSLGPLQSEALVGTLTMQLSPAAGAGTRITWEYVVGGYMRPSPVEMAALVDKVLEEQLGRLAARLGSRPRA